MYPFGWIRLSRGTGTNRGMPWPMPIFSVFFIASPNCSFTKSSPFLSLMAKRRIWRRKRCKGAVYARAMLVKRPDWPVLRSWTIMCEVRRWPPSLSNKHRPLTRFWPEAKRVFMRFWAHEESKRKTRYAGHCVWNFWQNSYFCRCEPTLILKPFTDDFTLHENSYKFLPILFLL